MQLEAIDDLSVLVKRDSTVMASPTVKSSPAEDTGKLKSMVLILRDENQVCLHSISIVFES